MRLAICNISRLNIESAILLGNVRERNFTLYELHFRRLFRATVVETSESVLLKIAASRMGRVEIPPRSREEVPKLVA